MVSTTPTPESQKSSPSQANVVELKTKTQSKIQNVSLYSSQAEITRSYQFDVVAGLNQVNIIGLPNTLQKESIRVEGKGSATIHDVTVSMAPSDTKATTSDVLQELLDKKQRIAGALKRAELSIGSLQTYLNSFDASRFEGKLLGDQIENYEAVAERLDERVMQLRKDEAATDAEIVVERQRLSAGTIDEDAALRMKVGVGVFAAAAGPVDLILIYGVTSASWTAAYDVRVSMNAKETPMSMIYKAVVCQNTGEDWNDVPLTLETASPSFGVDIPTLDPWTLSLHPPAYGGRGSLKRKSVSLFAGSVAMAAASEPTIQDSYPQMDYRKVAVTSQGNVNATFTIPGLVSVPSDGELHTFTIATLDLQAELSWVAVPNKDPKVHLKAKVTNSSEYTLLAGSASIYVDGSFISKSNMPPVSPQEKFDYSLGLDPSIRVTYHPRTTTLSQSGFYNKSSTFVYTQRITVHNTKTVRVDNVKIIDQIPISEHSDIVVKLDTPALSVIPPASTVSKLKNTAGLNPNPPVKVASGVMAQWEVDAERDHDAEPGRDGKISWVVGVPEKEKVSVVLKWDVTAPARGHVYGL
ncbi:hypothetical protein BDZ89DRAFT_1077476 [Hymenopellis radicata]|nr:hypothetical protein BDZ89DRAFT_1077476 [Hymenopellis radicata]